MRTQLIIAMLALTLGRVDGADIVVHRASGAGELDLGSVRDIFLGRKTTWDDGSRIEIVVLKDGGTHQDFLRSWVGRSPSQFSFHWRNLLFTGKGRMPTEVADAEAMAAYLRAHPSAIGYLPSAAGVDGLRRIGGD